MLRGEPAGELYTRTRTEEVGPSSLLGGVLSFYATNLCLDILTLEFIPQTILVSFFFFPTTSFIYAVLCVRPGTVGLPTGTE